MCMPLVIASHLTSITVDFIQSHFNTELHILASYTCDNRQELAYNYETVRYSPAYAVVLSVASNMNEMQTHLLVAIPEVRKFYIKFSP